MPAEGPAVSAGARRGGDERAGRTRRRPPRAARACCRTLLPDIPSFDEEFCPRAGPRELRHRRRLPARAGRADGAASPATARFDEEHERRDCSRRRGGGVLARGLGPELALVLPETEETAVEDTVEPQPLWRRRTGSETGATRGRLSHGRRAARRSPRPRPRPPPPRRRRWAAASPETTTRRFSAPTPPRPRRRRSSTPPPRTRFETPRRAPEAGNAFSGTSAARRASSARRPNSTSSPSAAPSPAALGGAQLYSQPAAAATTGRGGRRPRQGSQYGGGRGARSTAAGRSRAAGTAAGRSRFRAGVAGVGRNGGGARVLQPQRHGAGAGAGVSGGGAGAGVSGGGVAGAVSAAAAAAPVGRVGYGGLRRAVGVRATAAMARGDVIEASSIGHYVSRLS